jgi:lipoprotein-releasing system permease protein
MNLSLKIAARYLFAKKSTNAINVITGISVIGLALGTTALVLVLSVFNGFEKLITGMMSNFNPDVKIIAAKGKTFQADTFKINTLRQNSGIERVSETLEEVAFFQYDKSQAFGTLKGVDDNFHHINHIDSTVKEGVYKTQDENADYAVLGAGMRNQLGVYEGNFATPLSIYMPRREQVGALEKQFKTNSLYAAGTFVIQQDFDNQYIITNLDFVRSILDAPNEVSALELQLKKGVDADVTVAQIRQLFGTDFIVKNRYKQDEGFLKLMNVEKWMSYAILSLTLLLVAFNMVGALWMIVLEKKKDISILRSMGATDKMVRNIFLNEGILMCLLGLIIGFIVAIAVYQYHITAHGGIIPLPPGFATDRYPVALKLKDFFVVGFTVISIGFLASLPAAFRAIRVESDI